MLRSAVTRLSGQLASISSAIESQLPCSSSVSALCQNQIRTTISIPVQSNRVDRALKTLTRLTRAGGTLKEWRAQEFFVKPAEQRVLDAKESTRRRAKRRFKQQMAAIANRQAQGF